jgi:hypothetical protein
MFILPLQIERGTNGEVGPPRVDQWFECNGEWNVWALAKRKRKEKTL